MRRKNLNSSPVESDCSEESRNGNVDDTDVGGLGCGTGIDAGTCRYVGMDGAILGMKAFRASTPLKVLQKEFGFTANHVVEAAKAQLVQAK